MKRLICVVLLFVCYEATGQSASPKYSNEFLSIGVGARALGMSGSQVAHVNDVTAGYWNPAGLLSINTKYEASLMHAEYFAGIAKYDYAAFALGIDSVSKLAVSIIRFAVDDIPDTRFLYDANGAVDYSNIRFFSAADYGFIFSYARKFNKFPGLRAAANFKIVHRNVGEFANAWGFGMDIGAQYVIRKWHLGLMLRDITGTFNAWSHNTELVRDIYAQTGNELPQNSIEVTLPKAILGVSRRFIIKENLGILTSTDFVFSFDGKRNVLLKSDFASIDFNFGAEFDYKQLVFLRLGIGNIQEVKDFDNSTFTSFQPNAGLGFKINNILVDYALTDIGDQSESLFSHVFSLKIQLPGSNQKKLNGVSK